MATVDIDLIANTQKALKSVKTFSSQATKAVSSVSDSFFNLRNVAIGALAGIGIGKFVRDSVAAAAQQEQAVQQLNTALALTGELTEENTQDFLDFASALQANSTVGDEVSLSLIGLSKSFGATNEQAKLILETAANLSAVTGESLESSVRNLSKTLGGLKGELGETQPELRELTQEQLRNGDAITILAGKYEGAAKALTKTFSGALQQTSNSFGDLLEEIGKFITDNPAVIAAINLASEVFNDLGKAVAETRGGFSGIIESGIRAFIKIIPTAIRAVQPFIAAFQTIELVLDATVASFLGVTEAIVRGLDFILDSISTLLTSAFDPLINKIVETTDLFVRVGFISEESGKQINGVAKAISGFSRGIGTALDSTVESVNKYRSSAIDAAVDSADSISETARSFENAALEAENFGLRLDVLKAEAEQSDQALKNLSDANREVGETAAVASQEIEGLFMGSVRSGFGEAAEFQVVPTVDFSEIEDTDPIKIPVAPDFTDPNFKNLFPSLLDPEGVLPDPNAGAANLKREEQQQTKFAQQLQATVDFFGFSVQDYANATTSILNGAEGARQFLSQGSALVADAFLPGLGQAVGPLVDAFSQGPEFVRQQVQGFAEALPVLLDNIAQAIPVFIDALAEAAPDIIVALVKAAPAISRAIIVSLGRLPFILAQEFSIQLAEELDKAFGTTISTDFEAAATRFEGTTTDLQNKYLSSVEDGTERILSGFQSGLNQFTSNVESSVNRIVNGVKISLSDAGESIRIAFENFFGQLVNLGDFFEPTITRLGDIFGAFGNAVEGLNAAFMGFLDQLFAFEFPSLPELVAKIPDLPPFPKIELGFEVSVLSDAIRSPFDPIIEFFRNLKIDLPEISVPGSGGGGGFDPVGSVRNAFGFADGGRVPDGFPNDTFPARLSSGEEVFDTSTSQLLRDFLADQSGGGEGQNVQINLQIGEKQLADVMINLNRQGFRLAP